MRPSPQYQGKGYKPSGKLAGKAALITGGDSGIGRSVALLFAREGADVAIMYLPAEERDAQVIKQEIEKIGRKCIAISGDITDSAFCKEAVEKTVQELGGLDILVNNVAAMLADGSIDTLLNEDLEKLFKVNVFSYFYVTRAALKHMKEGSCIINTGSIVGSRGGEGMTVYASTKAATHTFTKSLAKDLLHRGIRVNCVAPGPVWTPLQDAVRLSMMRFDRILALADAFAVLALGVRLLDLCGIQQHEGEQVRRRRRAIDRAVEAMLDEFRQQAGMVDMGVGEDQEFGGGGVEGEILGVQLTDRLVALEHAAIDEKARVADLQHGTRAGDGARRAVEGKGCHADISRIAHRQVWQIGDDGARGAGR